MEIESYNSDTGDWNPVTWERVRRIATGNYDPLDAYIDDVKRRLDRGDEVGVTAFLTVRKSGGSTT